MRPIEYVEGQSELWCLLCPFGEFPGTVTTPDGQRRPVLQVCDKAAFDAVIAAFEPEVLVDFEHRSESPKLDSDTAASGWIQELRLGADGLEARNKLTDLGAADLSNRRRRFLSPVWYLDAGGRPTKLKSAGLTNTPNIRGEPVLNKESGSKNQEPGTKNGQSPAIGGGEQERSPEMDLKAMAKALGLPDTATAEDVLAAVKAVQDKAAALETRVAEMEAGALKAEAEGVVAANKELIAKPAEFVEIYCANKAFALKALAAMAQPRATVCNKGGAKPPAIATGVARNKLEEYRAMPQGKAKEDFLRDHGAELLRLDNAAKAEG